jgi:hypothetical protein
MTTTHTSKITRDPFTEKLLEAFQQLVSVDGLSEKKEWAGKLGMLTQHWNSIESGRRNFPRDPERRAAVKQALFLAYGINPDFLDGKTSVVFRFKPEPAKRALGQRLSTLNFQNKAEKSKVLDELDRAHAAIRVLESILSSSGISFAPYVPAWVPPTPLPDNHSDSNSDKK